MYYIKTNSQGQVIYTHAKPEMLCEKLGVTMDDLAKEGYFIESFPEVDVPAGKQVVWFYNETDGLTYQLADIELQESSMQKLQELQTRIELMQQVLDDLILGGMQ